MRSTVRDPSEENSSRAEVGSEEPDNESRHDDRSTRAKIRDAAIASFAEYGIGDTTARKVAAAAGVSPGSVIHHFGSMEGLRAACDQHLLEVVKREKTAAMSAGANLDILGTLRTSSSPNLMAYLARVLTDDSPAVTRLIDDFVTDAEVYLQEGVDAGMLEPTADTHGRAVIMTLWNLGSLVLYHHLHRLLGVDLTDPDFTSEPSVANYLAPIMEIYGGGVFTEAFMENARTALADLEESPNTNTAGAARPAQPGREKGAPA
jgi:AcrR family transcriptional regulator